MNSPAPAILLSLALITPLFAQPVLTIIPPGTATNDSTQAVVAVEGLAFDSLSKEYKAKPGETEAPFIFHLTNISSAEIIISDVKTSCGCTVAQLPQKPWPLAPGTNGQIKVGIHLAGKQGRVTKQVNITTSIGNKTLLVTAEIPPPLNTAAENLRGDRNANIQKAMADRQLVFKGDCRSCHVDQGVAKLGKELFVADCAICHDTPLRAAMVPDLRAPKSPRDENYWRGWIAQGRAGSLMPAFAESEGGPLSKDQIESLVAYLMKEFPRGQVPTPASTEVPASSPKTGAGQ